MKNPVGKTKEKVTARSTEGRREEGEEKEDEQEQVEEKEDEEEQVEEWEDEEVEKEKGEKSRMSWDNLWFTIDVSRELIRGLGEGG